MSNPDWTVIKVGGSLFDLPDFRDRLRRFLAQLGERNVVLVPGGGDMADAVRELDRVHQFGEEASHWLAIQALSLNACFLQTLLPGWTVVAELPAALAAGSNAHVILDALPFFRADEARADHLPYRWQVTSDSLAVRVAVLFNARELVLLKSVAWGGGDWTAAARLGLVDDYFAQALQQAPVEMKIRIVNLRTRP